MSKLSESIYDGGLVEEITRITGAELAVYSNKARIVRLNQALDRYWQLASDAAPKGTFDDTNQSAAPIETQNLAAGTNNYKLSSFTNQVLQILKISILEDDGTTEVDLIREEFDDYNEFLIWYSTVAADRGQPHTWTKYGDYIYIRPSPDYSETNGLRAYVNRELSKFVFTTFTVTIASPGVFSAAAHGLAANDAVILETDGALPAGLAADTILYYVISTGLTAGAFQVSATIGGSAVNTSGTQSGNHKFTKATKEPGIPVIHHDYLARYASLPFLIEKQLGQTNAISQRIALDEQSILDYWQNRDRDLKTIIRPKTRSYR